MRTIDYMLKRSLYGIILTAVAAASLNGCGDNGPAVAATPQTISFGAAPPLLAHGTATVSATASSGLAVSYTSTTPAVCSVNSSIGVVTDTTPGVCIIAANQSGNTLYAPAPQVMQTLTVGFDPDQTISFGPVPPLSVGGTATVTATASSGLPVTYSSTTPAVCSVAGSSGLVTGLAAGNCTVAANQAGDSIYHPAPQVTQTITVSASGGTAVPGAPGGVSATAGTTANTVRVSVGSTTSGGSPITSYTVTSSPAGITANGTASPLTVTCPVTCTGYAFSVFATNARGNGPASTPTDVITTYKVQETFHEPDTQPRDSIFIGSFTYNSTTRTVSKLGGILSESMTGSLIGYPKDTMTWLPLTYQLSSLPVTLGGVDGLLVTTFMLNTTNTLSANPSFGGSDGWSPGTGMGLYYGFPTAKNPAAGGVGNAYARIFVNTANPTAPLAQSQIDKLAYADCAPGGMMGATCMTGTTVAGYGSIGTMSGFPVSQVITIQP